jgi:hypothetical protein
MSEDTIDLKEDNKESGKETVRLEKVSPFTVLEQAVLIGSTDTDPSGKLYNARELMQKAAAGDMEAKRILHTPLAIQHKGLSRDDAELKRKQVKGYRGIFSVFDIKSQTELNGQGLVVRVMLGGLNDKGEAEPMWMIRAEKKEGENNYFGDDIKKLELKQGINNSSYPGMHFDLGKELKMGKEEDGSEYYYRVFSIAPAEQVEYQKAA